MTVSDVACFQQQQAMQEEAARQGLHGLAANFSRHAFIEARATKDAEHILNLIREGKHEEAQSLMATSTWGQEELEEGKLCHTTTTSL